MKNLPDYKAIVIDCHYFGIPKFENNVKNDFCIPEAYTMNTYKGLCKTDKATHLFKELNSYIFRFEDIMEIKKHTSLPIIIKSVLSPE